MPNDLINRLLDGPFELTSRPEPIPADLRLTWGLSLLVLMLGRSRSKRASLQKLNFLAHSIRTRESREAAMRLYEGNMRVSHYMVRVEPWLNRAIAFSKGYGLAEILKGRTIQLLPLGSRAFEHIYSDDSVLAEEKAFLDAIGKWATEQTIERVMKMDALL